LLSISAASRPHSEEIPGGHFPTIKNARAGRRIANASEMATNFRRNAKRQPI